jgi:hypothetical protein
VPVGAAPVAVLVGVVDPELDPGLVVGRVVFVWVGVGVALAAPGIHCE